MKQIKFMLVAVLTAFISHSALAQGGTVQGLQGQVIKERSNSAIEGSPYLYEDWDDGYVVTRDGERKDVRKIRYDIVKDRLVILTDNYAREIVDPTVGGFVIEKLGNDLKTKEIIFSKIDGSYYQVLEEQGDLKLLKRYTCELIDIKTNEYGDTGNRQRYFRGEEYYLMKGDELIETKLKKKDFVASFGDMSSEAESYIKENGVKVKSEEGASMVIRALGR